MTTLMRRLVRLAALPAFTLLLGVTPVLGQQAKEPPPKEVTDGFFDVPARDTSQDGPEIGIGSYILAASLSGGAMFVLCKSARRG